MSPNSTPDQKSSNTFLRTLRDGILLLGISVLLAAGLELGTRLILRLSTGSWPTTEVVRFDKEIRTALGLYRRHPYLNTAPVESASAAAFGKTASFNSLGYRSPERPLAKPEVAHRVLVAGGSTTFDILAATNQATWPYRLEAGLQKRDPAVEVWNAGFPGWTTVENLVSLALRDIDLVPDMVVLYQGINDLQPGSYEPFDRQYVEGHAAESVRALGFELAPPSWYEHSVFVERVRLATVGSSSPFDRLARPSSKDRRLHALPTQAVAVFERNVRSFISIATSHGATVLLVTQPLRIRQDHMEADRAYLAEWVGGLEPDTAVTELGRLNGVLRRLAAGGDAHLADAAREISWRDDDFADPMHFSDRGSLRFSEYLTTAIDARLSGSD